MSKDAEYRWTTMSRLALEHGRSLQAAHIALAGTLAALATTPMVYEGLATLAAMGLLGYLSGARSRAATQALMDWIITLSIAHIILALLPWEIGEIEARAAAGEGMITAAILIVYALVIAAGWRTLPIMLSELAHELHCGQGRTKAKRHAARQVERDGWIRSTWAALALMLIVGPGGIEYAAIAAGLPARPWADGLGNLASAIGAACILMAVADDRAPAERERAEQEHPSPATA